MSRLRPFALRSARTFVVASAFVALAAGAAAAQTTGGPGGGAAFPGSSGKLIEP